MTSRGASHPAAVPAPERLDHFMARANSHYYANHDPFADFATSPEISQVFGELLGAWSSIVWQSMGSPARVILAEAGPGRGTLMADVLRVIAKVAPAFHAALDVHLVETSPSLRLVQAGALEGRAPRPVRWHDRLDDLPPQPFILLSNEFLDALPIRQFVRQDAGWAERYVQGEDFVLMPALDLPDAHALARPVPLGEILEICEPAGRIAHWLGARLSTHAGAALVIDYGYDAPHWGDSLQAICNQEFAWPLHAPGSADLTAHVDFREFCHQAQAHGALVHETVPQGEFLTRLGIFQRVDQLVRNLDAPQAWSVRDAVQRLVAPDRMGRLFRVAGLRAQGMPPLPGFA